MVLSEQMIRLIFKVLNFLLLFGVCVWGVKKYLLPGLKEQLTKYIAHLEGLRRSHRALQKDERTLKKSIADDERQQEQLKKNVKLWRSVVHEQRDALLRERENRKDALEKSFDEHKKQTALYRTYKQVVPEAIEQARRDLEQRFAQESAQQPFMKKIMRDMRKQ